MTKVFTNLNKEDIWLVLSNFVCEGYSIGCDRNRKNFIPSKRKGRDLIQSYDKALTPTKNLKRKVTTQKTPPKNLDFTTISDWLRTVSWSNDMTSCLSTAVELWTATCYGYIIIPVVPCNAGWNFTRRNQWQTSRSEYRQQQFQVLSHMY